MNSKQQQKLEVELKAAGASNTEIKPLTAIVQDLGKLKGMELDQANGLERPRKRFHLAFIMGIPAGIGLALGMVLVVASQTVLPGSPLYPVQAASDSFASALNPSYKGTVMMKRAEQVKQLVADRAPSDRVYATLADYKKQAASYTSVAANYAAFEYCKDNLQQAATHASGSERQAINATLSSLSNV